MLCSRIEYFKPYLVAIQWRKKAHLNFKKRFVVVLLDIEQYMPRKLIDTFIYSASINRTFIDNTLKARDYPVEPK